MRKKMTAAQKKFLMVTLPEFILREQGRGFAMEAWFETDEPGEIIERDDVERKVPKCGTVACIGGSAELLLKRSPRSSRAALATALGLSKGEGEGLFYNYGPLLSSSSCSWPESFARRYEDARTPLAKAKVAAALVKLVGKTEGKCLHAGGDA